MAAHAEVGVFSSTHFDPERRECFDADALISQSISYYLIDGLNVISTHAHLYQYYCLEYFIEFVVACERPDDIEYDVLRSCH